MAVTAEDRAKDEHARTDGPISFQHREDGLWPVGEDGWPITAEELQELEGEEQNPPSLPGSPTIDIEPESVVDHPASS